MLVVLGTLSSGKASALQSVLSDAADGRRFRTGVKKAQAIDEIITATANDRKCGGRPPSPSRTAAPGARSTGRCSPRAAPPARLGGGRTNLATIASVTSTRTMTTGN